MANFVATLENRKAHTLSHGMGTITIEIRKKDVYDEVGRMTAYLGQRRSTAEDAAAFDRVELTGSDEGLLDSYWGEAVGVLCLRLQRYIAGTSASAEKNTSVEKDTSAEDSPSTENSPSTEEDASTEKAVGEAEGPPTARAEDVAAAGSAAASADLTLNLTVSGRFNKGMEATLPDSVKSYLASYILQRWCSVSAPGETEYYAGLAAGFMAEVTGKVCCKTRPTRKGVKSEE